MKSIGSEAIKDVDEKLARILEIAGISKNMCDNDQINVESNILQESIAADGTEYSIIQEEKHIYIKKKINENYEYMTGVENIHEYSYQTYADALKDLNLMFRDINLQVGQNDNISLFKKKT